MNIVPRPTHAGLPVTRARDAGKSVDRLRLEALALLVNTPAEATWRLSAIADESMLREATC